MPAYADYGEGISLIGLINILLRRRLLILLIPPVAFIAGALFSAAPSRQFVAKSMFVTAGGGGSARPSGLAAQLGLTNSGPKDQSPEFYQWLLNSQDVLRPIAQSTFRVGVPGPMGVDTIQASLAEFYERAGEVFPTTPKERLEASVAKISGGVSLSVDGQTGFLVLVTKAPYEGLAVQLNRKLLDHLHKFNLERRREQVAVEREFVEERMRVAEDELAQAETALQHFMEQNRAFQSPQLALARERLERRVNLREQIFLSLAQTNEQMRIEEARNTPLIGVVEQPEFTVRAEIFERRPPVRSGLIAAAAGLILAIGLAFVLEFLSRQRKAHPEEFEELRALSRDTVVQLRPVRILGQIRGWRVSTGKVAAGADGNGDSDRGH